MKKLIMIFGLVFLFASCDLIESKEKKAIKICQNAKFQQATENGWGMLGMAMRGLNANSTWLDYVNIRAQEYPHGKYSWSADKTEEKNIYLVAFMDEDLWGFRWEVDVDQQIVRHVNQSEYLSRKYGLSTLDHSGKFRIVDVTTDTLKLERKNRYSSTDRTKDVVYEMKGSIMNNSGTAFISADISGKIQLVFKDKTVESSMDWESGFKRKITKSNPWKPEEVLDFYIKTKDIEDIYLLYYPEYVFFIVGIKAEDPVGFEFDRAIKEYDLRHEWSTLLK